MFNCNQKNWYYCFDENMDIHGARTIFVGEFSIGDGHRTCIALGVGVG